MCPGCAVVMFGHMCVLGDMYVLLWCWVRYCCDVGLDMWCWVICVAVVLGDMCGCGVG